MAGAQQADRRLLYVEPVVAEQRADVDLSDRAGREQLAQRVEAGGRCPRRRRARDGRARRRSRDPAAPRSPRRRRSRGRGRALRPAASGCRRVPARSARARRRSACGRGGRRARRRRERARRRPRARATTASAATRSGIVAISTGQESLMCGVTMTSRTPSAASRRACARAAASSAAPSSTPGSRCRCRSTYDMDFLSYGGSSVPARAFVAMVVFPTVAGCSSLLPGFHGFVTNERRAAGGTADAHRAMARVRAGVGPLAARRAPRPGAAAGVRAAVRRRDPALGLPPRSCSAVSRRLLAARRALQVFVVIALVVLGWALARDSCAALEPLLFRRMDTATAGTAGFVIRLLDDAGGDRRRAEHRRRQPGSDRDRRVVLRRRVRPRRAADARQPDRRRRAAERPAVPRRRPRAPAGRRRSPGGSRGSSRRSGCSTRRSTPATIRCSCPTASCWRCRSARCASPRRSR